MKNNLGNRQVMCLARLCQLSRSYGWAEWWKVEGGGDPACFFNWPNFEAEFSVIKLSYLTCFTLLH
jgi:hypothetical protein